MSIIEILNTLFLKPLQLIFEIIFMLAYDITDNPGVSIIVLSLLMNFLLLPLYRRADVIQQEELHVELKMREGIAHIKKTFHGDERMMMLQTYYRQNNYKPTYVLRGAISLGLEIPFFMAAYTFLSNLQLLNGIPFGPIMDLGKPDAMINIGGIVINFLPILMTAINIISSLLYTKGSPLKAKIQLYVMAMVFLVLLYNSPAGLVFYWTMNNLFSLVKTIFDQIKNSKIVLCGISSGIGVLILLYGIFECPLTAIKLKLFYCLLGILFQIPLIFIKYKRKSRDFIVKSDKNLFFVCSLFIVFLVGLLIPSTLISSSPQEFINPHAFYHPLWYLLGTFTIAFGLFFVWTGVFYALANTKGKVIIEYIMAFLSVIALIDYMFFGKNHGLLTSTLRYENTFEVGVNEQILNLLILSIILFIMGIILKKHQKQFVQLFLVAMIAVIFMTFPNILNIKKSIQNVSCEIQNDDTNFPQLKFSKNGKNVLFIMLDRAYGGYMPYFINERPELVQMYDGFTYFSNTISFGGHTNFGSPALYGGYEYTPLEMNKRSDEFLMDKHNEALKVLPTLFSKNGFHVTITDAPYTNYQWIPEPSFFDDIPNVTSFNTTGIFTDTLVKEQIILGNQRNFFCYSLMKILPSFLQNTLYHDGTYRQSDTVLVEYSDQRTMSPYEAEGIDQNFMDAYTVLTNLPALTDIVETDENQYISFTNDATHIPVMLQEPEYVPQNEINNEKYEKIHSDRFTVDGCTIKMENEQQMIHYQTDMAALLEVGKWLEYLKEQGVYDNTRIIIAADHGYQLAHFDEFIFEGVDDMDSFYPLLMFKDFNSKGFNISDKFMTNGDVPSLAVMDVIKNPVNPYTGKNIISESHKKGPQYIIGSHKWDIQINNGKKYLPSLWYTVHDDIRVRENWSVLQESELSFD